VASAERRIADWRLATLAPPRWPSRRVPPMRRWRAYMVGWAWHRRRPRHCSGALELTGEGRRRTRGALALGRDLRVSCRCPLGRWTCRDILKRAPRDAEALAALDRLQQAMGRFEDLAECCVDAPRSRMGTEKNELVWRRARILEESGQPGGRRGLPAQLGLMPSPRANRSRALAQPAQRGPGPRKPCVFSNSASASCPRPAKTQVDSSPEPRDGPS